MRMYECLYVTYQIWLLLVRGRVSCKKVLLSKEGVVYWSSACSMELLLPDEIG